MKTYTVHEPPGTPTDRLERAESLVFVREGFNWGAALLTPFWMLANRLWLALLGYLVLMGAVQGLLWLVGASQQMTGWLLVALHVLIGFEADAIRRWTLGRKGYTMIASVTGHSVEDCERRFYEAWLDAQPFLPPTVAAGAPGREGRLGHLSLGFRKG